MRIADVFPIRNATGDIIGTTAFYRNGNCLKNLFRARYGMTTSDFRRPRSGASVATLKSGVASIIL